MYYAVLLLGGKVNTWEVRIFVSYELKYQASGGHACNSWENLWPPALIDSPVTKKNVQAKHMKHVDWLKNVSYFYLTMSSQDN